MIKAYAKSDVGKVREMNQDYYYISNSLDEVQLYILADGMGGYNGGEIASKIAVETAKNYIENNFKEIDTRTFNGYGMFPKLKYNWNKYLLVGIVRTYLLDDFAIDYTDNTYRTTDFIIRRDSNE